MLFRKIHNCGKKRITTRYDFCLRASHECLILQGEEKRKRRKSKKHQKAIARSFQEVHRPRRDLLGREREQKIIKKGKKVKRWSERQRGASFSVHSSREAAINPQLRTRHDRRLPVRLTDFFPRTHRGSFEEYHAILATTWHPDYFRQLFLSLLLSVSTSLSYSLSLSFS